MNNRLAFLFVMATIWFSAFPTNSLAKTYSYVNFSPDLRYSIDGNDSRVVLDVDKGLFSYGSNFGKLAGCGASTGNCINFDFMAVARPSRKISPGDEVVVGLFKFVVTKRFVLRMFGVNHDVYRVDVTNSGKKANSYLYENGLGVIAIILQNFDNKDIPELTFFVRDKDGIFGDENRRGE